MKKIDPSVVTDKWLARNYYSDGCNLTTASSLIGVEKGTLWAWLKRRRFPTKPQAESQRGTLNGFAGRKHSKTALDIIAHASRARQHLAKRGRYGRYGNDEKHQKGPENPTYKNGAGIYRRTLDERGNTCARCGAVKAGRKIHIHHKDRNRKNNTEANKEVLCSKCHNLEHFPGRDLTTGRFASKR